MREPNLDQEADDLDDEEIRQWEMPWLANPRSLEEFDVVISKRGNESASLVHVSSVRNSERNFGLFSGTGFVRHSSGLR